ncbi:MAG: arsenite efflux transporter metallochaperone ArsD [Candidatus Methanoperedens sp.]|nr:arsenite efflux transporter metallochaperone ArsD [Candidatus Methanoperedens sp.]
MAKINLIIYEGAMCCSTGVCGPEPNKELIEFNETLEKIRRDFKELKTIRASLSFNLNMFLENEEISQLVKENGQGILPITTINGKIIAKQKYLTYAELKKEIENNRAG